MNTEKLAKHLKEFTLDEINMIAECDCKIELEHLLNSNKISFEQGIYKYLFKISECYKISIVPNNRQDIKFEQAVKYFLDNYAKLNCAQRTYETYESIFRTHITPYFRGKYLNNIINSDIEQFYNYCIERYLRPRRLKNILTQLNQLIKYFQNLGVIDKTCEFQVKRITDKNNFNINRIVFN